jgi:hypothetical protein
MQRLSEDLFRQEWNSWMADDQNRWKQFTLTNDEAWRSHDKEFEAYTNRIKDLIEQLPPLRDGIDRLWAMYRARVRSIRDNEQALLDEYDTQGIPSMSSAGVAAFGNGGAELSG